MSSMITVLYGIAALTGATFAAVEFRMLWRFLRNRREIRATVTSTPRPEATEPAGDEALTYPLVTIQLPLYNERRAAEQIIRAASAQDYPRDRFDVQVLDDSNDETTEIVAAEVERLRAAGRNAVLVRRPDRRGYKAGALDWGMGSSHRRLQLSIAQYPGHVYFVNIC